MNGFKDIIEFSYDCFRLFNCWISSSITGDSESLQLHHVIIMIPQLPCRYLSDNMFDS